MAAPRGFLTILPSCKLYLKFLIFPFLFSFSNCAEPGKAFLPPPPCWPQPSLQSFSFHCNASSPALNISLPPPNSLQHAPSFPFSPFPVFFKTWAGVFWFFPSVSVWRYISYRKKMSRFPPLFVHFFCDDLDPQPLPFSVRSQDPRYVCPDGGKRTQNTLKWKRFGIPPFLSYTTTSSLTNGDRVSPFSSPYVFLLWACFQCIKDR